MRLKRFAVKFKEAICSPDTKCLRSVLHLPLPLLNLHERAQNELNLKLQAMTSLVVQEAEYLEVAQQREKRVVLHTCQN